MIRVEEFPTSKGPLDVSLGPGEVILLKGPNGSGKTSFLRALGGFDAARNPRAVQVQGRDPRSLPAPLLARLVCYVPQDARDALAGLTVGGEFRLRAYPLSVGVAHLAGRDVATLSTGESRRVGVALAAASTRPLLLLDEPLEGLDIEGRAGVRRLVIATRDAGGTVVLVDHEGELAHLATRTLDLAPSPATHDVPDFEAPDGGIVLEAPFASVRRGAFHVEAPAISLGPGFHALAGPNGAGKSTVLLHLAGLLHSPPARVAGAAARCGRELRVLPPRARDLFTAPTVADELAGCDDAIADAFVPHPLRTRHPFALSGGEQQRVALALTLGTTAPVYLLDEPEAHLDAAGRAVLLQVLGQRIAEGSCVLAATHDAALQARALTRIPLGVAS